MPLLSQILSNIKIIKQLGETNLSIDSIVFDSRKVEKGSLFVAINGTQVDGHNYILQAIASGAAAIVYQDNLDYEIQISSVKVEDSAFALGLLASNFYDHPSSKLKVIGITGTNGKTTIATLLYQLFSDMGYKCGLLSTVNNRVGTTIVASTHTTPDAVSIQSMMKEMGEAHCEYCFMEVSSHALDQKRTAGIRFACAVFSNLTHDHLDYHGSFEHYLKSKKILFDQLPDTAVAISNADDKNGKVMLQNCNAKKQFYALKTMADFKGKVLENNLNGIVMEINGTEIHARLAGDFNAYNLLAVYGVAKQFLPDEHEILTCLSNLHSAEGRFHLIKNETNGRIGIVDYAHTPDALEKVLKTIEKSLSNSSKIVTVIGCGGDRDKLKRPIMAKIACQYSDQVVFTSDNPRTEDPLEILSQMEAGLDANARQKSLSVSDRLQAIRTACKLAKLKDVILVAGKGHEKFQDIKGIKYPFDDTEVLTQELKNIK